jgi:hypothetical protein
MKRASVYYSKTDQVAWERSHDILSKTLLVGLENEVSINRKARAWFCNRDRKILNGLAPCKNNANSLYSCLECRDIGEVSLGVDLSRAYLVNRLVPTSSHYRYGNNGVNDICGDHSVPDGVEIKTTGIPLVPEILFTTYSNIIHHCNVVGGEVSQYTGLHFHILSPGIDDLTYNQYAVSPYMLHNLLAIGTMALPILAYYSRGLKDGGHRYCVFCMPYFMQAAQENQQLMQHVRRQSHDGKYLAITPYLSGMVSGILKRPHIEFRYPDNILDPSYWLFHVVLCAALMNKAISMPPGEIISLQDPLFARAQDLITKMMNMGAGERKTLMTLKEKDIELLSRLQEGMIEELGDEIAKIDPNGNILESFKGMRPENNWDITIPQYDSTCTSDNIVAALR